MAQAQDTRTVTQPSFPAASSICTTLLAQQASGSLNQTLFDTTRIKTAVEHCGNGHAVELSASGSDNAFLTQPFNLSSGVTLLIDAGVTLYGSLNPADYGSNCGTIGGTYGCNPLISASSSNEAIMGYGAIDGQGGQKLVTSTGAYYTCPSGVATPCTWWNIASVGGSSQNNPYLLQLHSGANNFVLYGITFQNSPMFHVVGAPSDGLTLWDVKIVTPDGTANTDGFDPGPLSGAGAADITITNSFISDGDDEVAIKGNDAISNITVSHNHFYDGHGMSIGSETNGGVSNVLVTDLVMSGDMNGNGNGLRIKSNSSEGGTVSNINYQDVCILNVENPLVFNPFYSGGTGTEYPNFESISLQNIHVTTATSAGKLTLEGYNSTYPLNMTMDNVVFDTAPPTITTSTTSNANFTLGPDPVSLSSNLLALNGTNGITVTDNISDSNSPYDCTGKWVYLAGEIFTKTASVSGSQPAVVSVIVEPVVAGYAAPNGTVYILENGASVASSTVAASGNLTNVSFYPSGPGQHTYTAQYAGDTNPLYSYENYPVSYGTVTVTETGTSTATTVTHSPASVTYGQTVTYTATVSPAGGSGSPSGTLTFTVDGTAQSPSTLSGGSAALTLSLGAGSHSVSAAYGGDSTFMPSSGSDTSLIVSPATPVVAVSGGPFTYNGASYAATCSVTSPITGGTVAGTCALTYNGSSSAPAAATVYTVNAVFTPGDTTDFTTGNGSGSMTINPATPSVTVVGATYTYDGNAHGPANCSATASLAGGTTAVPGSCTYTYTLNGTVVAAAIGAGTYSVSALFTPNDATDFTTATGSGSVTINPATPALTVSGGTFNYDGNQHLAACTAALGTNPVSGSCVFTYTLSGNPVAAPVNAGSYAVSALFTPGDTVDFTTASGTTSIVILQVGLTAAAIDASRSYGTGNPAFGCTVTGAVGSDSFTCTPGTSATLASPVGTYAIVPVVTGSALANYTVTLDNATLTISQATLTITANNAAMTYGAASLPAFSYTPSGFLNNDTPAVLSGSPSLTTTASASSPVGSYPILAAQGSLTATNYSFTFVNGTLTINPATPKVMLTGGVYTYNDSAEQPAACYATASLAGVITVVPGSCAYTYTQNGTAVAAPINAGTYAVSALFTPTDANDFNPATGSGSLVINQAVQTLSCPTVIWNVAGLTSFTPCTGASGATVTYSKIQETGGTPAPVAFVGKSGTTTLKLLTTEPLPATALLTVTASETQNYLQTTANIPLTVDPIPSSALGISCSYTDQSGTSASAPVVSQGADLPAASTYGDVITLSCEPQNIPSVLKAPSMQYLVSGTATVASKEQTSTGELKLTLQSPGTLRVEAYFLSGDVYQGAAYPISQVVTVAQKPITVVLAVDPNETGVAWTFGKSNNPNINKLAVQVPAGASASSWKAFPSDSLPAAGTATPVLYTVNGSEIPSPLTDDTAVGTYTIAPDPAVLQSLAANYLITLGSSLLTVSPAYSAASNVSIAVPSGGLAFGAFPYSPSSGWPAARTLTMTNKTGADLTFQVTGLDSNFAYPASCEANGLVSIPVATCTIAIAPNPQAIQPGGYSGYELVIKGYDPTGALRYTSKSIAASEYPYGTDFEVQNPNSTVYVQSGESTAITIINNTGFALSYAGITGTASPAGATGFTIPSQGGAPQCAAALGSQCSVVVKYKAPNTNAASSLAVTVAGKIKAGTTAITLSNDVSATVIVGVAP